MIDQADLIGKDVLNAFSLER